MSLSSFPKPYPAVEVSSQIIPDLRILVQTIKLWFRYNRSLIEKRAVLQNYIVLKNWKRSGSGTVNTVWMYSSYGITESQRLKVKHYLINNIYINTSKTKMVVIDIGFSVRKCFTS